MSLSELKVIFPWKFVIIMDYMAEMGFVSFSESSSVHPSGAPALEQRERAERAVCATNLTARAAGGGDKREAAVSRFQRSGGLRALMPCCVVWKAGARSPEPATPPLGWTGAASPLDRCPGRNVPTHLHPEQDWRGHTGAHLSGASFSTSLLGLNLEIRIYLDILKSLKGDGLTQVT